MAAPGLNIYVFSFWERGGS